MGLIAAICLGIALVFGKSAARGGDSIPMAGISAHRQAMAAPDLARAFLLLTTTVSNVLSWMARNRA